MRPRKVYLGDSVYAQFDGWSVILTTENGAGPSNTIYCEPSVLAVLDRYRAELMAEGTPEPDAPSDPVDDGPEDPDEDF